MQVLHWATRKCMLTRVLFSVLVVFTFSVLTLRISLTHSIPYRVLITEFRNNMSGNVVMVTAAVHRRSTEHHNVVRYNIFGNIISNNTKNSTLNRRQESCNNCFQHSFKYIIENDVVCKGVPEQKDVELLILVTTTPSNFLQRQALRETWLSYSRNNTANVRHLFLFGKISDTRIQDEILTESKLYKDILQEDFVDAYENLTYKTIMGFKWAAKWCQNAQFVLKTDDDMYINVPAILGVARANSDRLQNHVVGNCMAKPIPIRNKTSKWYTSMESFPGKYFHAGYCAGTGYLTSLNVVTKVYEVSPDVPFFRLEDVYVAFCIKRLGFRLRAIPGFHKKRKTELQLCQYKTKEVLTSHNLTAEMLRMVWTAKCN